jgi:hypothetical protein
MELALLASMAWVPRLKLPPLLLLQMVSRRLGVDCYHLECRMMCNREL